MATATNQYNPDYAVPPGWILEEELDNLGLSQAEFARQCGFSPKLISEIVSGEAPIEPQTATQFDRVLGGGSDIWVRLESTYRLRLAQQAEAQAASDSAKWAKKFPVNELVKRGIIAKPSSAADTVATVLSFFSVGSIDAWESKYNATSVVYRHSLTFQSNPKALATWLRLGEIEAEQTECADYDQETFTLSLMQIRALTATNTNQVFAEAKNLCQQSGVALCFTKPFPGVALSGAAWWRTPRNPIIQLSARHMTNDHLWFSLFHEAAHILLHSNKQVFIDPIHSQSPDTECKESQEESEADQWAQDFLIPRTQWDEFANSFRGNPLQVHLFAEQQGIAPGIIVGRLQHQRLLPWNRLNDLKVNLEWSDAPPQSAD